MEGTKKRVVVVGLKGLPAFGGVASVGENLIEQLKNEYHFTILSISSHTSLKTGYYKGVKQIVFKSFLGKGGLNTAYYYFVSLLYVLLHKFDIAHLHHAASGFITPLIRLKCKIVLTLHASFAEGSDPKFNRLLNYLGMISTKIGIKCANKIVHVSLFDQEIMEKKYKKEIIYIPNGTNLPTLQDKNSDTPPYLLFSAARIYNVKGLHLLIEAANNLHISKKIKIVGDLDRVPTYKAEILQNMKGLNVDLIGLIKEKSELIELVNQAELFIFPSLHEAMSMMLLEVAAMKVPIIASDIPENKVVFSSEEVLFFKSGDAEDLAEKLTYAFSNMDDLKARAEKAYVKLVNNYTWDKIAQQYRALFQQIES